MKYLLLMHQSACDAGAPPEAWSEEDMAASGAHMMAIHAELAERGELVGAEQLAGPDAARVVTSDGRAAPVVTDGPLAEAKEVLAGYWLVDVDSEERALEIAARTSAAPGPGGVPTQRPIEVRALMTPPMPAE